MNIDRKTQHAILFMLLLARRRGTVPQSTFELARELNISESYLQQLSRQLLAHGLIKSRRGPYGGYSLDRFAENISIGEVIRVMINYKSVSAKSHSRESILWDVIFSGLLKYLDTFSIKSLATNDKQSVSQDLKIRGNDYFLRKLII